MLDKLGKLGLFGVLLILVGLTVVAWKAPWVAAGLAVIFVGTGLVIKSFVSNMLGMFGMA